MSTYPPAHWKLGGWGVGTIGLVDGAAAFAFVPAGAQLIRVVPGKSIGGLFFLSYECGSLVYRELNVVAGLVRVGLRVAFLLPRRYVDSPASLAGGRDVWAVPKELADFEIDQRGGVTSIDVRQGSARVCRLRCTVPASRFRLSMPLPSFGVRDDAFLFFSGQLRARMAFARAEVEMPPDGEFAPLGLDRPSVAALRQSRAGRSGSAHRRATSAAARVALGLVWKGSCQGALPCDVGPCISSWKMERMGQRTISVARRWIRDQTGIRGFYRMTLIRRGAASV